VSICSPPKEPAKASTGVTRHSAPGKGRITLVTLTEAGYAKVVASAPAHVATVRRLVIDPLTKQQLNQLGRASETILGMLTAPGSVTRCCESESDRS
jgi:hypothetical protein